MYHGFLRLRVSDLVISGSRNLYTHLEHVCTAHICTAAAGTMTTTSTMKIQQQSITHRQFGLLCLILVNFTCIPKHSDIDVN